MPASSSTSAALPAAPALPRARLSAPRPRGLRRDRLHHVLERVWDGRFGLLVAPAGAGKTTLLGQFADASGGPVAWYRADAADSAAAPFLAGLERSVTAAFDLPGDDRPRADPPGGRWSSPETAAAALETFAGPRGLLVIDDLHVLFGSEAEAALGRLLDYLPPTVTVVAASRRLPGFDVSRMRVSGALVEIGPDDLRFRAWEVDTLFREFYGEPLPPEDTAELARRTGGWSAGLTLFHLATQGKPAHERRRLVGTLAANSRLVREYLARHLMDELPADLRRFLIDTSVLGRLTGPLCDALLGARHSARTLEQLERRQLFTSEIDRSGTYRYHEVLRVHLETVLVEELGEDLASERYRRAAVLLEEAGAHADAVRAHCRAADWEAAVRLLGYRGEQLALEEGSWIDAVPAPLLASSPWLLLARARRYVVAGRLTDAADAYREAETAFGQAPPARLCRAERLSVREWTNPGAGFGADWVRIARAATRAHPQAALDAAARLPGPTGRFAEGLAACLAGRHHRSLTLFRAVADSAEVSPVLAVGARFAAAFVAYHEDPPGPGEPGPDQPDLHGLELASVAEEAERAGIPLLAQLSRALVGARGDNGLSPIRPGLAMAPLQPEGWAAAFVALDAGLARLRRGEDPTDLLAGAAAGFTALDAPVCAAYAERALASTRAGPGQTTTLRCLGRFSLILRGREVDLTAAKPRARALFRLLAFHQGRSVHRETLVEALWPESGAGAGTRSLQVAVSTLRGLIEPGCPRGGSTLLVRQGDSYRLVLPEPLDSDLATFEAAQTEARQVSAAGDPHLARAALRRARTAYGGDLLPEDGPAEWVIQPREGLRLMAAEVAQTEAGLALDAGDSAGAVDACTWGLAIDPYQDVLWRRLIRAHETAGDHAAAFRAQRQYGRMLDDLGLARPAATPRRGSDPRPGESPEALTG